MKPHGVPLPVLAEPYGTSLREATAWIFESYDVCGLLVTGTLLRGTGDPRSDLDIHVLHGGRFRERVQKFFNGVPCEIFVNPPDRVPAYFMEDVADLRPIAPHMYATGLVLFDPEGHIAALAYKAKELLAAVPSAPTEESLIPSRYSIATEFEDVLDLSERDPDSASVMLGGVVVHLLELRVQQLGGWKPRNKDLVSRVRELDGHAAALAIAATGGGTLEDRLASAKALCILVTGAEGFFEWTSPREDLPETSD